MPLLETTDAVTPNGIEQFILETNLGSAGTAVA